MPKIKKRKMLDEEDEEEELEDTEDEEDELEQVETKGRKPKVEKRRFGLIGPQPLKIVDTESNELIGEGEFAVIQALTDILERLERIEVQIGAITG